MKHRVPGTEYATMLGIVIAEITFIKTPPFHLSYANTHKEAYLGYQDLLLY